MMQGTDSPSGEKWTRTQRLRRFGATWGPVLLSALALLFVSGCEWFDPRPTRVATLTPSPTAGAATPTPTHTVTATPTPSPTPAPTATPIPPVQIRIEFPRPVTALEPVSWRVLIDEPSGVDARVRASARVIDAQDEVYAAFDMVREGSSDWWVPTEGLQLPLEPEPYPGVWHMIVDVDADLPVRGYRDRVFTPQRVPYHVLTDTLPSGVQLRVPAAFREVETQGDPFAGLGTWQYRDCELTLAWAPGPTEELLIDNALVMAEATFPGGESGQEVSVEQSEALIWGAEEWTAFLFQEQWRGENGSTPAESLVVQGPDFRLYALRTRAKTGKEIHPLCLDVRDTLDFVTE